MVLMQSLIELHARTVGVSVIVIGFGGLPQFGQAIEAIHQNLDLLRRTGDAAPRP